MLKRASLAMVACLSIMGTAHAGEDNAAPSDATDVSPPAAAPAADRAPGDGHIDIRGYVMNSPPGDVWIDFIDFQLIEPDIQELQVQMTVDRCEGEGCQKAFQFVLDCSSRSGSTFQVVSPWYRNYSTDGTVTKTYRFTSPALADCDNIDNITFNWQFGWDGTESSP